MRKLLTGMMAAVLCFSMAATAFAAGGYASDSVVTNTPDYTPPSSIVSEKQATKDATKAISSTEKGETATVTYKNVTTIDTSALKAVAAQAEKAGVKAEIAVDKTVGGKIVSRVYIDPAKASELTGKLNLSVSTESKATKAATETFQKFFTNEISVVSMGQKGAYGMDLKLAVKVDLTKLDPAKLVFYAFDKTTNTFAAVPNPAYFVDVNGYLHFTTPVGGDIVITDKALTAK